MAYPYLLRPRGAQRAYIICDGSDTIIDCGSGATVDDLADDAFTVEAWISANSLGENNNGFIATKGDFTVGWRINLTATGIYARIECATAAAFAYGGGSVVGAGWVHVAVTWDDASFTYPKIWINGTISRQVVLTIRSWGTHTESIRSNSDE